jgi:hypothetical protein
LSYGTGQKIEQIRGVQADFAKLVARQVAGASMQINT